MWKAFCHISFLIWHPNNIAHCDWQFGQTVFSQYLPTVWCPDLIHMYLEIQTKWKTFKFYLKGKNESFTIIKSEKIGKLCAPPWSTYSRPWGQRFWPINI